MDRAEAAPPGRTETHGNRSTRGSQTGRVGVDDWLAPHVREQQEGDGKNGHGRRQQALERPTGCQPAAKQVTAQSDRDTDEGDVAENLGVEAALREDRLVVERDSCGN